MRRAAGGAGGEAGGRGGAGAGGTGRAGCGQARVGRAYQRGRSLRACRRESRAADRGAGCLSSCERAHHACGRQQRRACSRSGGDRCGVVGEQRP
eukprot:scaffold10126_cov56-Phaeocystis_antarctica.AAC.2